MAQKRSRAHGALANFPRVGTDGLGVTREIELKLEGDPDVLAKLRKSRSLAALGTSRARSATIETVYYDSKERDLAEQHIALRVRRNGKRIEQTVKHAPLPNGGIADRIELTAPLDSPEPNLKRIEDIRLRQRIAKSTKNGGLSPICRTHVKRVTRRVKLPGGGEAELAFDVGEIAAANGDARLPISELELELRKGKARELVALARRLAEEFPIRLAMRTKPDRGFALSAGAVDRPRKAETVKLPADPSAESGYVHILSHCLSHALDNEGAVRRARNPEGVHQMRVALRRLRSAITAFGPHFDGPAMRHVRDEAKWLAGELGSARDLDVFSGETLTALKAARPGDARLAALEKAVAAARGAAWDQAAGALESQRGRLFMIDLAAAITGRAWEASDPKGARMREKPLKDLAARVLTRRFVKAAKLGGRIEALTPEERHALRIELKKLRYAGEFFQSLFPKKRARPYLKRLSELQDVFGALNDAAVAGALVDSLPRDGANDILLAAAGGLVTGWHMARAEAIWPEAKARWKALSKTPAFWE